MILVVFPASDRTQHPTHEVIKPICDLPHGRLDVSNVALALVAHNEQVSSHLPLSPNAESRGRTVSEACQLLRDTVPLAPHAAHCNTRLLTGVDASARTPLGTLNTNDSAAAGYRQSSLYRAAMPGNAPPRSDSAFSCTDAPEGALSPTAHREPSPLLRLSPRRVDTQDPQIARPRPVSRATPLDAIGGNGIPSTAPMTMGHCDASASLDDATTSPRADSTTDANDDAIAALLVAEYEARLVAADLSGES